MPDPITRRALLGGASLGALGGWGGIGGVAYAPSAPPPTITITGITLSNASFVGGAASGTIVGTIAVQTTGGAFTGTLALSGTNAADFQIPGTTLETSGVVAAGTYAVTITATQAGASGSPYAQAFTITGTNPGAGTMLAPVMVANYGAAPVAPNATISFAQPLAPGSVPSTASIQIRKTDGATVVASQQDQESTWLQDGSYKLAAISISSPDTFYPPVTISGITWAGNVATVATTGPHNLSAGGLVSILNAYPDCYNGVFTVASVPSGTSLTYDLPAVTGVSATVGSLTPGHPYPQNFLRGLSTMSGLSIGLAAAGNGIGSGAAIAGWGGGVLQLSAGCTVATGTNLAGLSFSPPSPATVAGIATPDPAVTVTATATPVVEYQIWSNPVAKSQTGNVTIAQITNASAGGSSNYDFKLLFSDPAGTITYGSGYSGMGGATWEVSVNDIVKNGHGAAWNPSGYDQTGWGTNPIRGWEVIRSGPVCTEYRFWSSLVCSAAGGVWQVGNIHPWLRGFLYLRCWGAAGPFEIGGGWGQFNFAGTNPGYSAPVVGISTNNTNTLLIGAYRFASTQTPTAGSGWTQIAGGNYLLVESKAAASAQSNTVPAIGTGTGNANGGIGDAIIGSGLAVVQQNTSNYTSGTSGTLTLSSSIAANSVIYLSVLFNNSGSGQQTISSIGSSNGLTYTLRLDLNNSTGQGDGIATYYAVSSSTLAGGETITVNLGSSTDYLTINAFVVTGANTTSQSTIFDNSGASDVPVNLVPVSSTQPAYQFVATLQDGAAVINSWGGAGDVRTINNIILPSAVNTTANSQSNSIAVTKQQFYSLLGIGAGKNGDFTSSASYPGIGGIPVLFSSTGTLPAPLQANQVYWLSAPPGDKGNYSNFYLNIWNSKGGAWAAPWVNAPDVQMTSGGSGTLTITPLACSFYESFGFAMDQASAARTWYQGSAPTLLVAHDFTYLTTKSRFQPPFVKTVSVNQQISFTPSFSQGAVYYTNYLGNTGDTASDDLVGYLGHSSCRELYRPFDISIHRGNIAIALSWSETAPAAWMDETVGLPANVINATQYTHLGTPNSSVHGPSLGGTTTASGTPGGVTFQVYPARDHSPCPQTLPYLKTGDHLFVETLLFDQNYSHLQAGQGYSSAYGNPPGDGYHWTVNGTSCYHPWCAILYDNPTQSGAEIGQTTDSIFGNERGLAWCARTMGIGLHIMPASRPETQYLRDQMSANAALAAATSDAILNSYNNNIWPNFWSGLGYYAGMESQIFESSMTMPTPAYSNPQAQPVDFDNEWMGGFQWLSWGMEAWKGEYTGWLHFLSTYYYKNRITRYDENPVNGAPMGYIAYSEFYQQPTAVSISAVMDTWSTNWDSVEVWGSLAAAGRTNGNKGVTITGCTLNSSSASNSATISLPAAYNSGSGFGTGDLYLNAWTGTNSQGIPNYLLSPFTIVTAGDGTSSLTAAPYAGCGDTMPNLSNVAVTIHICDRPMPPPTLSTITVPAQTPIAGDGKRTGLYGAGTGQYDTFLNNLWANSSATAPQANNPVSYHCIATSAVAMADVLYQQSVAGGAAIAAFQNAAAIYQELRRRQNQGPNAYAPNGLNWGGALKYAVGTIGSDY